MRRFLLTCLLLALAVWLGFELRSIWNPPRAESEEIVERPGGTVITQIKALARLEGAEFHMERIVDLSQRQERLRGLIQAEDALLLVAVGDVVAGVDLSGLVQGDITTSADGRSIRLRLPPAEIFRAALDDERTYVHSRETDFLAKRDEQLESKARQRAVEALQSGALRANILEKSQQNVRRTLTSLLLGLGFESVTIDFQPRAAGLREAP